MLAWHQWFEHDLPFDPAQDFPAFLKQAPAKWVVYLLADAADRPVQLLCVKDLRYSLEHRLGEGESVEPSKRVNYRELVRHVYWRRVDSAFEADVAYLECARLIFPDTYQGMVGRRPAWFVQIDPQAKYPRYLKTTDLLSDRAQLIGPLEDRAAANRLIALAEDTFELCRQEFHSRLLAAPRGRACAYKEMGRCPAPCDGSESLDSYRQRVAASAQALVDPEPLIRQQQEQMRRAAAELQFERAARIKALIDQLAQLGQGPFRHVRRLEDFRFLCLQRGPRAKTAKAFLVTPGQVQPLACLSAEPTHPADLLRTALALSQQSPPLLDLAAAERLGIVTHHLFAPKHKQGVFLPLSTIDERALLKAYRELLKQKVDDETEGEGVVQELPLAGY